MDTKELLKCLCAAPAVSGNEEAKAALLTKLLKSYTSDIKTDALGNIFAVIPGNGEQTLLLNAHMDTVGLIVTSIDEESGFCRIAPVGGADARTAAAQRVKIYGKTVLDGVITSTPPHLAPPDALKKAPPITELAVDCGLPYQKIRELVFPGDRAVFAGSFLELQNNTVSSPYLDDTAGIAVLFGVAERLKNIPERPTVEYLFSTREEVGKIGALAGVYHSRAKVAVAVDVSFASFPGVPAHQSAKAGSGAMIGCAPVLQKRVTDELILTAKRHQLPYTVEVMNRLTSTDADSLVNALGGRACGLISIPLKNMHTPAEQVDVNDIEHCAELLARFALGGIESCLHY